MNKSDKLTYVVPTCQEILLAAGSGVLRVPTPETDILWTDYRYPAYPVRCVKE